MRKILLGLVATTLISGCTTMTVHPQKQSKIVSPPTFEKNIPFFLWGLVGEDRVDVKSVCVDKEPVQMQTLQTGENALFTFITFGIYSPHTAKVWCE